MDGRSEAGGCGQGLVNSEFINNIRPLRGRAAALAVGVLAERDALRAAPRAPLRHFHDHARGRYWQGKALAHQVTKSGTFWRTHRYAPQA